MREVDRLAIFVYSAHGAVSLIVAETVLDTYNDPVGGILVFAPARQCDRVSIP